MLDSRPMTIRLAAACLLGWAATTNYTNHAAVTPLLMADLHFGPFQAGLLSTAFFVTLAIACVTAGLLSDRLGPTGVGTAGLLTVLASNVALGYVRHFPDLVGVKVVGGVGCGLAFVAGMRYAALAVAPAHIHRALGLYGGFVQLGGGTALYLMPLLASLMGWRQAFVASSALIALSTVAWLALAPRVGRSLAVAPLDQAVRSRKVWTLGFVHAATFGMAVLIGIWVTTFLVHDFGLSLVYAGAAGSIVLALGVLSRPLGGLLVDRGALRAPAMMRLTVLGGAVGLAALAWPGRPLLVATAAIVLLGVTCNAPYAAVMYTAGAVLPEAPGAAVGLVSSAGLLGIALGAPGVGALFAWSGGFALSFGALAAFSLAVLGALRSF